MRINTILILIVFAISTLSGCGQAIVDYHALTTWEYVNESSHFLRIDGGQNSSLDFILEAGERHSFDISFGTGKDISAEGFTAPYSEESTKIIVDGKSEMTAPPIIERESYVAEKVSARHFKFTYTFTDADFPEE